MKIQKNEQGIGHLIVLAVVVVVFVGGAGYYVYNHNLHKTKPKNSEATESADTTLAAPLPTDLLTLDKAKALAQAQKPNTAVLGVELENENGVLVFKVKLAGGTTLAFNARTGAVVNGAESSEVEGQTDLPADIKATITVSKAIEIALAQKSSGTVKNVELELEDGVLTYSVRFTDGGRVEINATTGAVIKTKPATKTERKTENSPNQPGDKKSSSNSPSPSGSGNSTTSGSHDSTGSGTETTQSSTPTESSHDGGETSGGSGSGSGSGGGGSSGPH